MNFTEMQNLCEDINSKLTVTMEIITPEIAKEYLKLNVRNYRVYQPATARAYAEDIRNGKWISNCQTVVFGEDTFLQDGQHRLNAVIIADTPAMMLVVRNAPVTDLYDIGKNRGLSLLAKTTAMQMATVNILVCGGAPRGRASAQTNIDYFHEHEDDIRKATGIVGLSARRGETTAKKAGCAAIAYCMLRTNEIPEQKLREFFRVVNSGIPVNNDADPSPALVLKKQLGAAHNGGVFSINIQLEATLKALNDYKNNNSRKRAYDTDTRNAERLLKQVQALDFQVLTAA